MDLGLTDRAFVVTAASSGLGARHGSAARRRGCSCRSRGSTGRVAGRSGEPDGTGPCRRTAQPTSPMPTPPRQPAPSRWTPSAGLDGALISVGGPPAGAVLGTSEEQWRSAFESVFLAALRVSSAVVRHSTAS